MDDCLVHSPMLEQHLLDLAEVLYTLHRHKLCTKRPMCELGRQELGFLSHRLPKEGVSVNLRTVRSIVKWSTPTSESCTEVRRFAGLANYHHVGLRQDGGAADGATAPRRFAWSPNVQAGLDEPKRALSSAPVLRTHFDPRRRRAVLTTTDASSLTAAAILTQQDDAGPQRWRTRAASWRLRSGTWRCMRCGCSCTTSWAMARVGRSASRASESRRVARRSSKSRVAECWTHQCSM